MKVLTERSVVIQEKIKVLTEKLEAQKTVRKEPPFYQNYSFSIPVCH